MGSQGDPRMQHFVRALSVIGLALCGCGTLGWETGLPWTQAEFRVESTTRRGPYLDVTVASDPITRRFFTPRNEVCEAMLAPGRTVTLTQTGGYGPFRAAGLECEIVGIGDLEKFRGSRSRGGYGGSPIERGNDRIVIVYRDEEYLYARGGFSIAGMFGWAPGTDQVVALLPRIPECRPLARGGFVSVLFREAGEPALGIVAGDDLCPVRGVIAVQPGAFDAYEDVPPQTWLRSWSSTAAAMRSSSSRLSHQESWSCFARRK